MLSQALSGQSTHRLVRPPHTTRPKPSSLAHRKAEPSSPAPNRWVTAGNRYGRVHTAQDGDGNGLMIEIGKLDLRIVKPASHAYVRPKLIPNAPLDSDFVLLNCDWFEFGGTVDFTGSQSVDILGKWRIGFTRLELHNTDRAYYRGAQNTDGSVTVPRPANTAQAATAKARATDSASRTKPQRSGIQYTLPVPRSSLSTWSVCPLPHPHPTPKPPEPPPATPAEPPPRTKGSAAPKPLSANLDAATGNTAADTPETP